MNTGGRMNCIYLNGHSYTADELRDLLAESERREHNWRAAEAELQHEREGYQAQLTELRAENARLTAAEADSHAAIVLLATENAATAAPEARVALGEALDADQPTPPPSMQSGIDEMRAIAVDLQRINRAQEEQIDRLTKERD